MEHRHGDAMRCLFCILLALAMAGDGWAGQIFRGSTTGGGGGETSKTCGATPFISKTDTSEMGTWTTYDSNIVAWQIPNSTSIQICKIRMYFWGGVGTGTLAVRSAHNNGGTLYGDTKTINTTSTDGEWIEMTWDSNYPELSGDIFLNVSFSSGGTGVYWAVSSESGWDFWVNNPETPSAYDSSTGVEIYVLE